MYDTYNNMYNTFYTHRLRRYDILMMTIYNIYLYYMHIIINIKYIIREKEREIIQGSHSYYPFSRIKQLMFNSLKKCTFNVSTI